MVSPRVRGNAGRGPREKYLSERCVREGFPRATLCPGEVFPAPGHSKATKSYFVQMCVRESHPSPPHLSPKTLFTRSLLLLLLLLLPRPRPWQWP